MAPLSRTRIRPPTLSSRTARGILDHVDLPEYRDLFSAIDLLGDLHDGLAVVRETTDPLATREARAVAYREQHERATRQAEEIIARTTSRLADRQGRIVATAELRAGIARAPAEAAEIRAALRSMSQQDRDRAIGEAIERGDSAVIASIRGVSPLLVGATTQPVETMVGLHLERAAPEMREQLDQVDHALRNLEMAAVAFRRTADEMRDLAAEQQADEGQQRAREAEAQLGRALNAAVIAAAQRPEADPPAA